ncbi:MAG: Rieske (2Fe-2S) protein [Armatimonadetes bacterium]|nr:Rieske (2Fe-2S) protein [Armatimonadota bacterium]
MPTPHSTEEAAPLVYPQDAPGAVLTPAHRARRQFLRGAVGTLIAATAGYLAWTRYLFPPAPPMSPGGVPLGKVSEFPAGGPPRLLPAGSAQPLYIVESLGNGQFRVLSAICTHQGCSVGWDKADPGHFNCPCHGAVYDLTGKNLGPPAPRPLPTLPYRIQGDMLYAEG